MANQNIIIFVIESLRYDRLYTHFPPYEMTEIIEFGKENANFHNCISVSNSSWMSTVAILMGNDSCYQHNTNFKWGINKEEVTISTKYSKPLFDVLQKSDYVIRAFLSPDDANNDHILHNTIDASSTTTGTLYSANKSSMTRSVSKNKNIDRLCSFLEGIGNTKFVSLVWNFDDHLVLCRNLYNKTSPQTRLLCYKETSSLFGKMVKKLKDLNLYDKTDIYLISDHGDSHYSYAEISGDTKLQHGCTPFHTTTHVPLIIKSDYVPKNNYYNLVSNIDLYTTILNSLDIKHEWDLSKNLHSLDLVKEKRDYVVSQNCFISQTSNSEENAVAITRDEYVYVANNKGKEYLFNYVIDPLTTSNLLLGLKKHMFGSMHAKVWFSDTFLTELEKILNEFRDLLKSLQQQNYIRKDIIIK